jgi:hypothetical protein
MRSGERACFYGWGNLQDEMLQRSSFDQPDDLIPTSSLWESMEMPALGKPVEFVAEQRWIICRKHAPLSCRQLPKLTARGLCKAEEKRSPDR